MELSKELNEKIMSEVESQDLYMYWDYNDELSEDQIKEILEGGLEDFEHQLWEYNLEYITENEFYFVENELFNKFEKELKAEFKAKGEDYSDPDLLDTSIKDYLSENYREHLSFNMNVKKLLNRVKRINCLITIYSNYDCCNSFDKFVDEGYIKEVYKRVQKGVHLKDYMNEFYNGAYGGSLFHFAFEGTLQELIELKEAMKEGKEIFIPKGTQFGFFSDTQGSGSPFEMETYKDFSIPIQEKNMSNYDNADIRADLEQYYTMEDVYGGIKLKAQKIKVIK